ncbi:MAG: OmpH family outer membrane protein [Woeseiaceae bacterium]|nr:OmpH family outer membrane protein [Woeseiaceae bacterium]
MSLMIRQLVKAVISVALVFAFVMPASAQDVKIGVVSLQAIVERAPQTTAVMDALREEFAPREREIVAKQKEIEDLQAKVQKDLAVMGETERRNAEKNLRDLTRDFERMRTEYQEDSNLRQNEEFGVLQRSVLKEVQDYAQAQGYDLIVGDGVLYVSGKVNITEAVLNTVIANYEAANK